MKFLILKLLAFLGWFGSAAAADLPPGFQKLETGAAAPDFKLPGIDGRDWTLADFAKAEVFPAWNGPQPHTVLIAPGGKIVFRHNGPITETELLDGILEVMTDGYQPVK